MFLTCNISATKRSFNFYNHGSKLYQLKLNVSCHSPQNVSQTHLPQDAGSAVFRPILLYCRLAYLWEMLCIMVCCLVFTEDKLCKTSHIICFKFIFWLNIHLISIGNCPAASCGGLRRPAVIGRTAGAYYPYPTSLFLVINKVVFQNFTRIKSVIAKNAPSPLH